jgi:hypothetical protein
MNWQYYGRIFLNSNPTPLDFSLLDNNVILEEEKLQLIRSHKISSQPISTTNNVQNLTALQLEPATKYVKIQLDIRDGGGAASNMINAALNGKELGKIRLKHPHFRENDKNSYEFHLQIPKRTKRDLSVNIVGWAAMKGELIDGRIYEYR